MSGEEIGFAKESMAILLYNKEQCKDYKGDEYKLKYNKTNEGWKTTTHVP